MQNKLEVGGTKYSIECISKSNLCLQDLKHLNINKKVAKVCMNFGHPIFCQCKICVLLEKKGIMCQNINITKLLEDS